MLKQNIWFILGLSGAGKTHFSNHLSNKRDWSHINIDHEYKSKESTIINGIDFYNLRIPWDTFVKEKNIEPLVKIITKNYISEKKCGAILSFPSDLIFTIKDINILKEKIKVIYLYSSRDNCLNSFLKRELEAEIPRVSKDAPEHWQKHNINMLKALPTLNQYKFNTFKEDNTRKSRDELYEEIANHDFD